MTGADADVMPAWPVGAWVVVVPGVTNRLGSRHGDAIADVRHRRGGQARQGPEIAAATQCDAGLRRHGHAIVSTSSTDWRGRFDGQVSGAAAAGVVGSIVVRTGCYVMYELPSDLVIFDG